MLRLLVVCARKINSTDNQQQPFGSAKKQQGVLQNKSTHFILMAAKWQQAKKFPTRCQRCCDKFFQQAEMLRKASSKFLQRHFSSNAAQRYAIQKLLMPSLSPTMESGMLLAWEKKHGDKIEAGDVIAKIKTDKAVVDFEAQENGFLAKILVQQDENKEVKVGTVCEKKILIFFSANCHCL